MATQLGVSSPASCLVPVHFPSSYQSPMDLVNALSASQVSRLYNYIQLYEGYTTALALIVL